MADDDRSKKIQAHTPGLQDPHYAVAASPDMFPSAASKLTLALDLRRALITVSTVVAIALIVGLTCFFMGGRTLHTYQNVVMTQEERDDLLDKYNGYSGTVTSALGRPLEFVTGMITQLLVLRFMASALLRPEPQRRVGYTALAVSAGLGFLLNNGFSAVNVQLRDMDVDPVIQASDLQAPSALAAENVTSSISNITESYPETQPNNSILNTLLRSAILPRALKSSSKCRSSDDRKKLVEDSVSFGFQQNDWMKYVLPSALTANKLRIVYNATDASANKDVKSADLPMNASLAADLLMMGTLVSTRYIPWGKGKEWNQYITPQVFGSRKNGDSMPTAVAAGLLPPTSASELEQRDFFLQATQTFFTSANRTLYVNTTSPSNVEMEFVHVDISPSVTFDSMTWRVEVNPDLLSRSNKTASGKRTGGVDCGPLMGLCWVNRLENDPEVVVHAFAACANEDGTETLQSIPRNLYLNNFYMQCPRKSNSSMILVSATRRSVADSVQRDLKSSGLTATRGTVTNPRKFYSFTIGRLAWTQQDLAKRFKATCGLPGGCMGLDIETSNGKRLLAGNASLPVSALTPIEFGFTTESTTLSPYRLVTVVEPPVSAAPSWLSYGDYLLPHNVADKSLNRTRLEGEGCDVFEEDREQVVLNNHIYMESTLQTTYTAGVFFLFQNGVVRDQLTLSESGAQTLAFDGNRENLALWISIPTSNALQTFAGCALLVLALLSAFFWSMDNDESRVTMQAITSPHVIARVLVDEGSFPSTVVHRRVVSDPLNTIAVGDRKDSNVENFLIDSLTLRRRNDRYGDARV